VYVIAYTVQTQPDQPRTNLGISAKESSFGTTKAIRAEAKEESYAGMTTSAHMNECISAVVGILRDDERK